MSLSTLLSSRYSCRAFLPAQVDEETLNERFTLAQRTPSWCNTQPWQVYVTSGDATTQLAEALSVYATSQEPVSCLQLPVGYTGGVRADRRGKRATACTRHWASSVPTAKAETRRWHATSTSSGGPPTLPSITSAAELGVYGAVDCGAYVSTLLLATQELGLGAVAQGAIAFHTDVVRSELGGIPEDQHIVCTVSFGHADTTHPVNAFRTTRADVHEAVHHVNTTGASL